MVIPHVLIRSGGPVHICKQFLGIVKTDWLALIDSDIKFVWYAFDLSFNLCIFDRSLVEAVQGIAFSGDDRVPFLKFEQVKTSLKSYQIVSYIASCCAIGITIENYKL